MIAAAHSRSRAKKANEDQLDEAERRIAARMGN